MYAATAVMSSIVIALSFAFYKFQEIVIMTALHEHMSRPAIICSSLHFAIFLHKLIVLITPRIPGAAFCHIEHRRAVIAHDACLRIKVPIAILVRNPAGVHPIVGATALEGSGKRRAPTTRWDCPVPASWCSTWRSECQHLASEPKTQFSIQIRR